MNSNSTHSNSNAVLCVSIPRICRIQHKFISLVGSMRIYVISFHLFKSNFNQKAKYYFICKWVWLASTAYRKFIPFPCGADTLLMPCLKSMKIRHHRSSTKSKSHAMYVRTKTSLGLLFYFRSLVTLHFQSRMSRKREQQ